MRKVSVLFVLLVGYSVFADGFVAPSEAKIERLVPMGDAYFVQFTKPVRFGSFDAVIPARPPAQMDKRTFDIQVGLKGEGRVYIRVLAGHEPPAGKAWAELPKDFREDVALLERLLDAPQLEAEQCPDDDKICDKECRKNPEKCCLWHCD